MQCSIKSLNFKIVWKSVQYSRKSNRALDKHMNEENSFRTFFKAKPSKNIIHSGFWSGSTHNLRASFLFICKARSIAAVDSSLYFVSQVCSITDYKRVISSSKDLYHPYYICSLVIAAAILSL